MMKRLLPILFVMIISGCTDEDHVRLKRGEAHREYHEKNGFDFNKRCHGCEVDAIRSRPRSGATVVNTCYRPH